MQSPGPTCFGVSDDEYVILSHRKLFDVIKYLGWAEAEKENAVIDVLSGQFVREGVLHADVTRALTGLRCVCWRRRNDRIPGKGCVK